MIHGDELATLRCLSSSKGGVMMLESQVSTYPARTAKALLLAGKTAWRVGAALCRRGLQLHVCKHRWTIGILDITHAPALHVLKRLCLFWRGLEASAAVCREAS